MHENESQLAAIHVTRERRIDLAKKQSSRMVYMCHVIGMKGKFNGILIEIEILTCNIDF